MNRWAPESSAWHRTANASVLPGTFIVNDPQPECGTTIFPARRSKTFSESSGRLISHDTSLEYFAQLLEHPLARLMLGCAEVQISSASVFDGEQAISPASKT
jgi:hypothetical protein